MLRRDEPLGSRPAIDHPLRPPRRAGRGGRPAERNELRAQGAAAGGDGAVGAVRGFAAKLNSGSYLVGESFERETSAEEAEEAEKGMEGVGALPPERGDVHSTNERGLPREGGAAVFA